jgi:hypothetical protein
MSLRSTTRLTPRRVKVLAAILIGLSIGTLLPPEPVLVPVIGIVPGLLLGGSGLLLGAVLYVRAPTWVTASACECSGDCGCS